MLYIQTKQPVAKYFYSIALVAAFTGLVVGVAMVAKADEAGWTQADPTYSVNETDTPAPAVCTNQHIVVDRKPNYNYSTPDADLTACVYDMGTWRYAMYRRDVVTWYGGIDYEWSFVASIGQDQKMYRINNISDRYPPAYVPNFKGTVNNSEPVGYGTKLKVYSDVAARLSPQSGSYDFRYEAPDFELRRPNGGWVGVDGVASSSNGKWLAFIAPGVGVMRLDLTTLTVKRIATVLPQVGGYTSVAISDDGQTVAVDANNDMPFTVYAVTEGCGDTTMTDDMSLNTPVVNPCAFRNLDVFMNSKNSRFNRIEQLRFNSDGGELTGYEISYAAASSTPASARWVTLRATGYVPPLQLDYLALGDSYSSGEGDTAINPLTGHKYYLPLTDVDGTNTIPTEKCHVSSRSYPFLLRDSNGIGAERMRSVACSGAVATRDFSETRIYHGQGGRLDALSEDTSNAQVLAYKDAGITSFIPGRIQQLEFADKYKPKTITLTAGGNDVGFGDKILACLSILSNCRYAYTDSGRADLGNQVRGMYPKLKDLYHKTKDSSPEAKIYVLGYPQFVSADNEICGALNVQLKQPVRAMIRESVTYLNKVIKAAAESEGVMYINVENALGNHILCGSEKPYVTGLALTGKLRDFGLNLGFSEIQETFHPNSEGNKMLAQAFQNQLDHKDLLSFSHCENNRPTCPDSSITEPQPTSYFSEAMGFATVKNVHEERMTASDVVKKGVEIGIKVGSWLLAPGSPLHFVALSDPLDLGTATTAPDGSLTTQITIPASLPAGYHTLQLHGKTFSGEDVVLTQIIRVEGPEGDIDEDNIPDNTDPCLFIPAAGVDADFDDIDDGCDPEISEAAAYRVRNGDVAKGETANFIYIERNIHATSVTGISDDSDPDNDGWAIVATSTKDEPANGSGNAGTPAHFWIEQRTVPATDPTLPSATQYIPHVSVRTPNFGCVQFTPKSLAKVVEGKKRPLKKEVANAATCRSESPEADTDNDGNPDNTQPLYRARNGDTAKGEDPTSLYLERSRAGAEVQLGISDYAPVMPGDNSLTGVGDSNVGGVPRLQPWNLLARSQGDGTKGVFKKLVMVNGEPVILIEKATKAATAKKPAMTSCIALQPNTVNVIRQRNQADRKLVRVEMVGGMSCDE